MPSALHEMETFKKSNCKKRQFAGFFFQKRENRNFLYESS